MKRIDSIDLTPLSELQRKKLLDEYHNMIENNLMIEHVNMTLSVTNQYIFAKARSLGEVQELLEKLPPSESTYTLGNIDKTKINRPFRISIENPASPNQYNDFRVNIAYRSFVPFLSRSYDVRVSFPVGHLIGFLEVTSRKVTESEHHYFLGVPMMQLLEMRVKAYTFKDGQVMHFYGGDVVLRSEREIDEIMAFIQSWKEVPHE